MSTPSSEGRLGDLLVREGLITEERLAAALQEQRGRAGYVPLGQILIGWRLITPKQLTLLLERAEKRPRLGEVLLRHGAITQPKLEEALRQQKVKHRPLGELLVRMGFLTDEALRQALSIQLNIPYVDLDRVELDRALTRIINRNYARRHVLVPVSCLGQVLTVSMSDPTNAAVADDLARSTGHVVHVVTSTLESIRRAFKRLYDENVELGLPEEGELLEVTAAEDLDPRPRYTENATDRRADAAVRQLLGLALSQGSSDVHLEMLAGRLLARFRVDGILREPDLGALQQVCDESAREVISRIKILGKLDIAERRRPQDGAFRARIERNGQPVNVDFRISILPGYYGESVVLRILDRKNAPTSVDSLGFSGAITTRLRQLLSRPAGILLITGPTGSGKSTTLYAALMSVYRPEIRILTAEDPIEYVYEQFSQSEVNERIGNTFARYLRAFLRHDPEVIMIGEIRDQETAEMAFRAAQTGHLLLSTLHTNDAISTVMRLRDMNVDPNLISSSLLGVLSQRLIRVVCPDCREEYEPSPELVQEFFAARPEGLTFYRGQGCSNCNFSGYKGRSCVAELWVPNEEDVIGISKSASLEQIRNSSRRSTISMVCDVMDRLTAGKTNLEELIRMLPYSSVYQFRQETGRERAGAAS
ncbi:MAG TPA: ATPase, T2SS/T4P/T4SS family [Vicinamibacterales bacterium]|nr:ATPase, T2SS/T4P/T4SS family [Vicinamibacterales bacterium]